MKLIFVISAVLCTFVVCSADKVRFDGYRVLRITANRDDVAKFIKQMEEIGSSKIDVWSSTDVMVAGDIFPYITSVLKSRNLPYYIMIEDVQATIDMFDSMNGRSTERFELDKYHPYDEILAYVDSVAETDTSGKVQIYTIGESFESRTMKMLKIGYPGDQKDVIWIDCGIHAREWISPATCLYFIDKLTSDDRDAEILTKYIDFYILPVVNPDGYEYTRTDNRMWRKTRSVQSGVSCVGVDGNRNYDFHWMENGASSNPCSNIYAGHSAFSEVETRLVRDQVLALKERMKLFLSIHSYGQYFLTPYGHTAELPVDYDDMKQKGEAAGEALEAVHGTQYTTGSTVELLYNAAGVANDWAYGVADVKTSYVIELRDKGEYGFLLPPDQIIPTGEETWEALKSLSYDVCTSCQQEEP